MKCKIAILEPYEGIKESLSLILEDYDLYYATDATVFDLLELLDDLNLLIVDIDFIPESLNFLKLVRQKYANLKILLLSTNFTLEYQESVIRVGTGFSFKEKPFKNDFLEYIQVLLHIRPGKPVNTTIRISSTGEIDIKS